ncbi:pyrroline-5-carboxylate reductase dimerization domain-containing protein [Methanobacterium spitsbergense]|uniref:Pyrroline-5-carboxylate reductase n=1 Tax=Methanobacterium spitsbergense TaxID=2874285 RepID=A0A8T5UZB1_9EURY|nr:pyrroline-5-carboxylate reductase dimerization domain-containing protein [Methanobacterium spitsbergense]MBZ2164921.1 NAD(P)-binding domain-containing protein [Methanobacterium spitsbergense]
MKQIGIIGYGNMGKVILNGFLVSKALKQNEVVVSTRTISKLDELKEDYPEIEVVSSNIITASKSDILFLFVGTLDIKDVLEEINEFITENTYIIYISAALTIAEVERVFNGKITKIIPSITSEVLDGVSLVCHNSLVSNEEANYIESLFSTIGDVKIVDEVDLDVGADITSCSPAFIAKLLMEFAVTASKNSGFSMEETEEMVIKTFYGTSKLLYENKISLKNLISTVATKGGITEEGINILDAEMPQVFNKLFNKTLEKHEIIQRQLKEHY